jgi:hypothetical protein
MNRRHAIKSILACPFLLNSSFGQSTHVYKNMCVNQIYVVDKTTGQTRKLERCGFVGEKFTWFYEVYCEQPEQKTWQFKNNEWPKYIKQSEVRRLLGLQLYNWLNSHNNVKHSYWINLTHDNYCGTGVKYNVKEKL